jgi:hypothetical protein
MKTRTPLFTKLNTGEWLVIRSKSIIKKLQHPEDIIKCVSINNRSWMLKTDGKLYVTELGKPYSSKYKLWDKNSEIIGSNDESTEPIRIIDLTCGNFHCLCLTNTKIVYGWGINIDNSLLMGETKLDTVITPIKILENVESIFSIENGNIITTVDATSNTDTNIIYYSFGSYTNIDYGESIQNTMIRNLNQKTLSFGFSNVNYSQIVEYKYLSMNFLQSINLLKFVKITNSNTNNLSFISKSIVHDDIKNIGNIVEMVSYRENIIENKMYNHNNFHCFKVKENETNHYYLFVTKHINFGINDIIIIWNAKLMDQYEKLNLIGFIKNFLYYRIDDTLYRSDINYSFNHRIKLNY